MSDMNGDPRLPVRRDDEHALAAAPSTGAIATFEELEPSDSPLQDYITVLLRRKWTVLVALVVVFGTTCLVTATTPRIYEATATLLVSQSRGGAAADLQGSLPPMMQAMIAPELETHVELLQGHATAEATSGWLKEHGGPSLSTGEVRGSIRARAVPKTQLIRLSGLARTPEDAEKIANAAAESYFEMNRQRAQVSSDSASDYLTKQLTVARDNLTKAENDLRMFKETTGTVASDAAAGELLARSGALSVDVQKTRADLAQAKQRLAKVREQVTRQNASIAAGKVRDNATVQQLRARLVELEGQRLAAQARYTDAFSAPLAKIDEQIRIVKEQLASEVGNVIGSGGGDLTIHQDLTAQLIQGEAEVAALGARYQELRVERKQIDQELQKMPAQQITLARLERDLEVAQKGYSDLLARSQEIEVGKVMALGNTSIAEPAVAPRFPVKPKVPLNLTLGLLLGLGVGVGLALLQEQLDDTVRDEEDIARFADAPILGTVPVFGNGRRDKESVARRLPLRAVEAYRSLRYSLGFVTPRKGGRVVLVTSCGPLEGKTTTALNLASAAARSGRRVVLIEGDLRRPSFQRLFSINGTKGLTDVLVGEVELSDVMQRFDDSGLQVVSAGTRAPNPTDLLDSAEMQGLLQGLRSETDLVVFDSAPLLSVADSLVLASLSDAILMVTVPGESNRRALQRSRVLLAQIGRHISGVVLNKVEPRRGYGYYGRYGYYYQYHDYDQTPGDDSKTKGGPSGQ